MALAMNNQIPDRVPVMCQLALGHYFLNTDIPPHVIWFTSEGFAEALVQLQRRYRFDGILINQPGRPPGILKKATSIENTDDGELIIWDTGEKTLIPWDDNAIYETGTSGRKMRFDFMNDDPDDLETVDELAAYVWGVYHIPWILGKEDSAPITEVPDYFLHTIDEVKKRVGDEVSIHGEAFSPFTHYMELIGYQFGLMSLLMDGGKAHVLLDRLTGASIAFAVAQARRGCDAVLISSAFAGGPMLSPHMYQEFVLPYEKRLMEAVKAEGVPVYTHTCGGIGDRLGLMVGTGTCGIDTLDPPPLGNAELADAKAEIGDKVFIKGNMNSVKLLQFTTEEEVIAHATNRIETGMPGGGYILSTACSVSPRVEPWKLELLTPLAEEIGRYE
jgi:hypothetical protein